VKSSDFPLAILFVSKLRQHFSKRSKQQIEMTGSVSTSESNASFVVRETLAAKQVSLRDKVLGTGSYSKVLVGYSSKLDKLVAIKKIDKRQKNEYTKRFLPRELKLVANLNHPNVIKVFDIIETPFYICMVEEYAGNGDLLKMIKDRKRIDEDESRILFRQFVEGLHYLDNESIVHRDLKCENLMLDIYNNLKIGDFGFARYLNAGESSHSFCGSKAYVALEIMQSTAYSDNSVDIWSAGVILYVMITGIMPFDDRKQKEMIAMQAAHKIRFPRGMPSESARKLIMQMLHPDPNKRATIDKIIASDWLRDTRYVIRGPAAEVLDDDGCSTASQISETDLGALRSSID
jgi:serine/threonine protein kinase